MRQRWEDWVNFILGIWLFFSPAILGYAVTPVAAWNAYILGVAFVIVTIWALSAPRVWEEWLDALLALWLVFSPWILGFSGQFVATWNALICGLIVLVLSLEAMRPNRQPHMTV